MSLVVNTNLAAVRAQRSFGRVQHDTAETFQRLTTGKRINQAKDDAAGSSISTRLNAQTRGYNQAVRNANDGISLAQVAEGALDNTTVALQRMRELAVQASNDTYTASDRADLQKEFDQLQSEIDRIQTQTSFNGFSLLDGGYTNKTLHVGAYSGDTVGVSIGDAGTTALGVNTISLGTQTDAAATITAVDAAIDSVNEIRAGLGQMQVRLESIVANLSNEMVQHSDAHSRISDADIAVETSRLTRNSIMQQANVAIQAQANQNPTIALSLLT
jgi:flagellin